MAEILDSGSRREFETGAVHVMADGKDRTDLPYRVTICDVPWPPEEEKSVELVGHKDPTGATGPSCEPGIPGERRW